jgi:membrane protein
MSLFPTALLGLSLLGLLGQYPQTYDAIMSYAREVALASVIAPLDSSLQRALLNKGTAATAVAISVAVALYGTTGVLEAARRALNVVFEIESGRGFLRRKLVDVASTVVLGALVLVTGILVFVGGGFAEDLFGFVGLGPTAPTCGTSSAGRPRCSWRCSSSRSSTTSRPTSSTARGDG